MIHVVAAENMYGNIAKQIGGDYVQMVNILNNPSQDPHLFSTTPSIAKDIATADIIVYNGADYDPWIIPLLNQQQKKIINIAELAKIPSGHNPHLWYSPVIAPLFANKIKDLYVEIDVQHQKIFEENYQQFDQAYQKIFSKIAEIKKRFKNTPVIATESVFNEMVESCGLIMRGKDFQMKMMNDIPPSISDVKSFENDLRQHQVRVLIYNEQVFNPLTKKMLDIAKEENIPIVGVTEMMPAHINFIDWILKELNDLQKALEGNVGK